MTNSLKKPTSERQKRDGGYLVPGVEEKGSYCLAGTVSGFCSVCFVFSEIGSHFYCAGWPWTCLHSPRWPRTHSDPLASTSQMLGLLACVQHFSFQRWNSRDLFYIWIYLTWLNCTHKEFNLHCKLLKGWKFNLAVLRGGTFVKWLGWYSHENYVPIDWVLVTSQEEDERPENAHTHTLTLTLFLAMVFTKCGPLILDQNYKPK